MTEAWFAKSTIATKIATMSNGPKTLGRMPGAMRSESNSLPVADLPTAPRLLSAVPMVTLPFQLSGRMVNLILARPGVAVKKAAGGDPPAA
jgi:hypothetical protein